MIEMFGIDVGDDRDHRGQAQERSVALVRLHHHPFAVAEAGIEPAIDSVLPLDRAREGFERMLHEDVFGKVVFTL
jgi:NADPH:quinone reductase-like Zn-dependent oxidoreductase